MKNGALVIGAVFVIGVLGLFFLNMERRFEVYPVSANSFYVKQDSKIRECMIRRESAEDKVDYSQLSIDLADIYAKSERNSLAQASELLAFFEKYSKQNKTKYDWNVIKDDFNKKKVSAFDIYLFSRAEGEALDKRTPPAHEHETRLICSDFHNLQSPDYWE